MQTIHLLPAYLLNAIKYSFHLTCNSPTIFTLAVGCFHISTFPHLNFSSSQLLNFSTFQLLNSPVPHSLFPVPHSLFPVPCSPFPVPYFLLKYLPFFSPLTPTF